MTIRKVQESPGPQGVDERIAYVLDTEPWGGYDSDAAVVLKNGNGDDVSSTKLTGSISISSDEITTPLVISLEDKTKYRLEVLWIKDGNTFEAYCEIMGEV